jgi:AhpD family alkylhydroperoxidase
LPELTHQVEQVLTMAQSHSESSSYALKMRRAKRQTSQLAKAQPEVMKAFYALSHSSSEPGALESKIKEIIAIAIGVATHCDECIAFHTQAALKAGASQEEILDALGVAIMMGGGSALMYSTHVMEALEEFNSPSELG